MKSKITALTTKTGVKAVEMMEFSAFPRICSDDLKFIIQDISQ
jgi:hypothetical protein